MDEGNYRYGRYKLSRIITFVGWYLDIMIMIVLWELGLTKAFCLFVSFVFISTVLQMIVVYYESKWLDEYFKDCDEE